MQKTLAKPIILEFNEEQLIEKALFMFCPLNKEKLTWSFLKACSPHGKLSDDLCNVKYSKAMQISCKMCKQSKSRLSMHNAVEKLPLNLLTTFKKVPV